GLCRNLCCAAGTLERACVEMGNACGLEEFPQLSGFGFTLLNERRARRNVVADIFAVPVGGCMANEVKSCRHQSLLGTKLVWAVIWLIPRPIHSIHLSAHTGRGQKISVC